MAYTNDRAGLAKPLTLAIDIGGSHLKAAVLKDSGKISTGPLRVETPKPATPDNTFDLIQRDLVASAVIELGGARTFVAEERQAQLRQAQREAAAERPAPAWVNSEIVIDLNRAD